MLGNGLLLVHWTIWKIFFFNFSMFNLVEQFYQFNWYNRIFRNICIWMCDDWCRFHLDSNVTEEMRTNELFIKWPGPSMDFCDMRTLLRLDILVDRYRYFVIYMNCSVYCFFHQSMWYHQFVWRHQIFLN